MANDFERKVCSIIIILTTTSVTTLKEFCSVANYTGKSDIAEFVFSDKYSVVRKPYNLISQLIFSSPVGDLTR